MPTPIMPEISDNRARPRTRFARAAPCVIPQHPVRPRPVAELQEALAQSRIRTRYQPLVSLRDGHVTGYEVLARLDHPVRGVIGPDQFVPQLETAGLGLALAKAVVRRAFADWTGGRFGAPGQWFAINIPLDVMVSAAAARWLDQERARHGIDAAAIVIELTESRPLGRLSALERAVCDLRGRGYRVAIDDVAPGKRDHRPLAGLPFTTMKLDKDLVNARDDDARSARFLADAIATARSGGLRTVAEGVEDRAAWEKMRALGVDEAQGYLIARPMPAAALPVWRRDWERRDWERWDRERQNRERRNRDWRYWERRGFFTRPRTESVSAQREGPPPNQVASLIPPIQSPRSCSRSSY